jgi:hypothetical protein
MSDLALLGNHLLIGALGAAAIYMVYTAVEAQKRVDDPKEEDVPTHKNTYKKDSPIIEVKNMSENMDVNRPYWEVKQIECLQNDFDPWQHPHKAVFWFVTMRQGHIIHVNMTLNRLLSRVDPKYKPVHPPATKGAKSNAHSKKLYQVYQFVPK